MTTVDSQTEPHATAADTVEVRALNGGDSISRLTHLYHRAYAKQIGLGLRPLAGRQDESTTRSRAAEGECYIATRRNEILGAVLLNEREHVDFPTLFTRPHVSHFSMFAVDPREQGAGIGAMLLDAIEHRSIEIGCTRLAMSVAESDQDLIRYYEKRGFEIVNRWQWPYTNYTSLIMSKEIGPRP